MKLSCSSRLSTSRRSGVAAVGAAAPHQGLRGRLFYESTLLPMADNSVVSSLSMWAPLPKADDEDESRFPLLFYGVEGDDKHEVDSPSFWNPHEAAKVRVSRCVWLSRGHIVLVLDACTRLSTSSSCSWTRLMCTSPRLVRPVASACTPREAVSPQHAWKLTRAMCAQISVSSAHTASKCCLCGKPSASTISAPCVSALSMTIRASRPRLSSFPRCVCVCVCVSVCLCLCLCVTRLRGLHLTCPNGASFGRCFRTTMATSATHQLLTKRWTLLQVQVQVQVPVQSSATRHPIRPLHQRPTGATTAARRRHLAC